ncbi:hypothetical protein RXV94_02830 [Yeosuana sp. MJ-SS3]|uniref:TonB C-terminal domain-containing protein n=1 Tax=Gilvirhabdus luticola TaxID=3079858 RepID=A0ABU3U3U1_9FLAO|nr:hypothetical protein [Yeosuana sp. MJ-SS3]MDU8885080.1 hypothetical protein [Yeosuana sp. MJ-SS3]
MQRIIVFLMFILLVSCEYFKVKKTSSDFILEEELQSFKWNEVDEYPTFSICENSNSKLETKQCFESTITKAITTQLMTENIIVTQDIEDTIYIKFQISEKGELSVLKIKTDSITSQEIPNIEDILISSLDSLPEIFPAIKRSQKVKTEFMLPIVINVN